MVPANRKADALQAMTLVEYSATLTTMGLFGFIFSSFADVGKSYLTFYCNAVRSLSLRIRCLLLIELYLAGCCHCWRVNPLVVKISTARQRDYGRVRASVV